ncbi:SDR family NAD(P)-dependent oxidoreductase [Parasphingorhabdus sp.]|jgi:NAD(P)-dependent dehydrogenase (short-subunit alcohol dehydrogenase family)|uniref:SDR family NAD(P)-dependent oxidoreductase n=1 Tax=Parasphingorhabdus sp. TaxID=2709688 RepID=UPI0030027025
MTKPAALVTGSNGGIGQAIVAALHEAGWFVIGIDRNAINHAKCDAFINYDLADCCDEADFQTGCIDAILKAAGDRPIKALVNNAAVQILGSTEEIKPEEWHETLKVNLSAPFFMSQALLPHLHEAKGSILNIGSVHAQATKKRFVAYATSKAALHGLTRALAVDLGPHVRVNCLAPAAIATDMLKAGFEGKDEEFAALEAAHPVGRIGDCEDVAQAALFLLSSNTSFVTGCCFYLDGGILSRLHDPV